MGVKTDIGKWLDRGLDKGDPKGRTERAQELIERWGYTQGTYIYKFINGGRVPSPKQIEIAAEYFGEPVPSFNKKSASRPSTNGTTHTTVAQGARIPVAGVVEAGAFREAEALDGVEPKTAFVPFDEIYPNATPMAWEVRGDSMNDEGMVDGTIAYGVNFQEAGVPLHSGMIVVVEQNRDGLIERSIKAVAVFPDRTEFQPRSNNPIHKPIVYQNHESGKHGIEVRVVTLIRGHGKKYW